MPDPTPAPWDKRSVPCALTWFTLRKLRQHKRVFKTTGRMKMKQLLFWHSSKAARDVARKTLVDQLDAFYKDFFGAIYEDGVTRKKATGALETLMKQEAATVADLAAVADTQYEFFGEA